MGVGIVAGRPDGRVAGAARRGGRRGRRADLLPAHGIESFAGKAGTKQAFAGGFETEDVLYLLPLVTLFDGVEPFLLAASIGAPLFAAWVVFDWWRIVRRGNVSQNPTEIQASK